MRPDEPNPAIHAGERARASPPGGRVGGSEPTASLWGAVGALSAGVAVAAGAFGAHALRASITSAALATFETAARYQLFHALALLVVAALLERPRHPAVTHAARAFFAGTLLFSGSLYALALTGQRWLGAITPLGGAAFLAGWLLLAWGLWQRPAGREVRS
jgi:uncharacterized membrane protein YgdD (TMEM256/DUF423 family)